MNFVFRVAQKRSVFPVVRNVNQIVEFGKNAGAAEFCNSREKQKSQTAGIGLEHSEEITHSLTNGFEERNIVQACSKRCIIFVNKDDERSSLERTHPCRQLCFHIIRGVA